MLPYPYIYGYSTPPEMSPNNFLNRIYAALPALPYVPIVRIEITEAARTTKRLKKHLVGGQILPNHIQLEDLYEVSSVYPERYMNFDTSSPEFNKINCIKVFRAITGCGLAEAKGCIEAYMSQKACLHFYYHDEMTFLT